MAPFKDSFSTLKNTGIRAAAAAAEVGNLSEQLPGLNLKHLGCSRVGAYRLAEMAFLTSAEKTLGEA